MRRRDCWMTADDLTRNGLVRHERERTRGPHPDAGSGSIQLQPDERFLTLGTSRVDRVELQQSAPSRCSRTLGLSTTRPCVGLRRWRRGSAQSASSGPGSPPARSARPSLLSALETRVRHGTWLPSTFRPPVPLRPSIGRIDRSLLSARIHRPQWAAPSPISLDALARLSREGSVTHRRGVAVDHHGSFSPPSLIDASRAPLPRSDDQSDGIDPVAQVGSTAACRIDRTASGDSIFLSRAGSRFRSPAA